MLHVYDTGPNRLPVFWHHGTPNTGAPPEPLFAAADRLGIRWVSYDRPGYPGSPARPGRDFATAAAYTREVADGLGIEKFAVMGHSSGGPNALACAALLPDRVLCAVSAAGLAPFDTEGLDWFAGMGAGSEASLRAAADGREAKERHVRDAEFDPEVFTSADHEALAGDWSWFGGVVNAAMKDGPGGLIDDDLANVAPWGFDPAAITAPVLLLHGDQDRVIPPSHGEWLANRCPTAEFWSCAGEGHISVLNHAGKALEWLTTRSAER